MGRLKSSLLMLAFAWAVLVPVPALSQPSQGTPSAAQYGQYDGPAPSVGDRAVHDAIVASGAIRASAEEAADENAVSAAELPHATGGPDIASAEEAVTENPVEELPDTGGPSPLWLGAPLLCAGSLLARKIFLP